MALDPTRLPEPVTAFLSEYHLATLGTQRADGTPHLVAVGFTWDAAGQRVRVITRDGSQKAVNAERGGRAAVTQVDGGRWLTLEGPVRLSRDPDDVRDAEQRYAARYRPPKENPRRVVVVIDVDRMLGHA
jgi:PPOX class probable F420-dependent enzyme